MPKFPYHKAALILAEATYLGRLQTCQKYSVPKSTFEFWQNRLKEDRQLIELYKEHLEKLREKWTDDAVRTLKRTLQIISDGLENHPFSSPPKTIKDKEVWGKNMSAMSSLIKSVGDLNISTYVLFDEGKD